MNLPLLEHVIASNQAHLDALLEQITSKDARRVGLLGLAFKADTDDMRGSAMVAIAETLLGRGYQIRIFDPSINLTRLIGANEAEIQRRGGRARERHHCLLAALCGRRIPACRRHGGKVGRGRERMA